MAEQLALSIRLPWHASALARLRTSFANGQVAHALLIHGEGGLHKRHLGRQIVQALLCQAPTGPIACGHCRGCLLYLSGNHPDAIEVHPLDSAVIKVDQIRDLSARLAMRPQVARRQVALLWPAEQMNAAAANALLKTLEEPSEDTHLLLLAERIGRLPATIRSRCQRLPLTSVEAGADWLASSAKVDLRQAQAALALSGGDPESALAMLEPAVWSAITALIRSLTDLAHRRINVNAFVAEHKTQSAALLQRWSRLLALAVQAEPMANEALAAWIGLTSRLEMSTLLPLATQVERARAWAGSGVREDLLIYDLAARWFEAFTAGRRKSAI